MFKRWICIVGCALSLMGCGAVEFPPLPRLVGVPRGDGAITDLAQGIRFGVDPPYMTGTIKKVAIECFRGAGVSTDVQSNSFWRTSEPLYDVAATANITYAIRDTAIFDIFASPGGGVKAPIRFRLFTGGGVVLEEAEEELTFTKSLTQAYVSVRFRSLSRSEIARAYGVSATWVFK